MALIDGFVTYGASVTQILNSWEQMGVFAYVLPFLLIFAVVFAILNSSKMLGNNKGVHATISLAVALMALQFDYVSNFFATIMPYTGIGVSVLLIATILMGLYPSDNKSWYKYVFFGIGALIFLWVIIQSIADSRLTGFYNVSQYWPAIVAGVVLLGLMALIIWGNKD
jgi:hypothetical protein